MFIVLITTGKHETVDTAEVRLYQNKEDAEKACKEISTGHTKYWTEAQILKNGEEVYLSQPEQDSI